ncbi:hypothetical protein J4207_02050 [Candidatus Woesearchaeota archaeon]|nr:hypothetical protein [Candidatus Woesearchaeota archaeon]
MNKKIIISIIALTMLCLSVFVFAAPNKTIDNFSLSKGWNLVYGFNDPSQIIDEGSNSEGNSESISADEIRNSVEVIYVYNPDVDEYVLLYAKEGTKQTGEYTNINPPQNIAGEIPTSVMWVYSERTYSMKYDAPEYPLLSNRDIIKGWNFVPVSPEMKDKSINELTGNCVFESIYTYAEEDGITQWINLGSVLDDKRMLSEASASGLQLVIKVKDDCRMST